MALGMTVVAVVSATAVLTVGALPLLGLVVPNVVRAVVGDHARRAVPWVALTGAALVLACDLVARTVIAPYEMPIATVLGVVGAVTFLISSRGVAAVADTLQHPARSSPRRPHRRAPRRVQGGGVRPDASRS